MKKSAFILPASFLLIGVGYLLASLTRKREEEQEQQDPHHNTPEKFDSQAGTPIGAEKASKYTKKYQNKYCKNTTFANYCGRGAILEILKNPDCVGVRMYRAINESGKYGAIVVGVDSKGNDIVEIKKNVQAFALAESYSKCRDDCDNGGTLYGGGK